MKFHVKPRIKAIEADSAAEFEVLFNQIMDEIGPHLDSQIEISDGKFYAVIKYQEEFYTPETLQDEFELRGELYNCISCPECHPRPQKNTKKCDCRIADYGMTSETSPACEWFYRKLAKGEIKVND